MRRPTLVEKLIKRLIVLPAVLAAMGGMIILLWSAVSWLFSLERLVSALPDAVLGLAMMAGGFFVAFIFGKLSTPPSGMPDPRKEPSHGHHEKP